MDIELEKVEEGVVDDGNGAVGLAFGAVVELEGTAGLVAKRERDPFDFVLFVFEMFARFPKNKSADAKIFGNGSNVRATTHALDRNRSAIEIRRKPFLMSGSDQGRQCAEDDGPSQGGKHVEGSGARGFDLTA